MMDFIDYNFDYNYNGGDASAQTSDVLTNYRCVLLNYPVNRTTSYSSYYTLWLLNTHVLYPPLEFTPVHNVVFQVAQVLLTVFLILSKLDGARCVLFTAYVACTLVWALFVMKSIDMIVWSAVQGVVVVGKIGRACWGGRGSNVSSLDKQSGEFKIVFAKLFNPVRVSWKQFSKIVACKRGFKVLPSGENYAVEKRTRVDSLALLISGRLVVSQANKPLHVILPFQFVDSPEYFGVATDELFQVTITALEDSKLLVWHRDKLRLTIMSDDFLRIMFDHIIGRDVVRKLIQVSDTIMTTTAVLDESAVTKKDCKYSYHPTYLSSLSEEEKCPQVFEEEEESKVENYPMLHT